jgi:hypothetical protein
MTFKSGYKRRKRTYSFRAWIDPENGWANNDRQHKDGTHAFCNCLKLWDLNRRPGSENIIRITRGKRYFVVLVGKNYHRIINIRPKKVYQ